MKYLFGPVPSRRYGRSLGVDLSVPKTCTLDCCFCQLGPTPQTCIVRSGTPPLEEVLRELRQWLSTGQPLDFITASGSGEPTLHLRFGDLFRFVHAETPYRGLLLSNGSLFFLPEIRREAALADVVKVSLHAWDQASFERIVRPHPSLRFDAILEGYCAFRQMFAGRLDLEVFIVPGLNDTVEQAARIAALARRFSPDEISINTAVRPTADQQITVCPPERLHELRALFGETARESGAQPPIPSTFSEEEKTDLRLRHPLRDE